MIRMFRRYVVVSLAASVLGGGVVHLVDTAQDAAAKAATAQARKQIRVQARKQCRKHHSAKWCATRLDRYPVKVAARQLTD